jgi:hypothetical protein
MAFASERGISVGEATSQLRRQAALNRFIERLKQRHPDKFSFVAVEGDRIKVGLTDPSVDLQSLLPPGLANVATVQAVYSEQGAVAELDALKRQLTAAGLKDVTVGVNPATGRVEFLTRKERAPLEAALRSGAVKPDHEHVVLDDEITTTASLDAGRAWNGDTSICTQYCGGTTGFSLISTTGATRYVSTAGHVDNARARYNISNSSTYSSGGTSLGTVTDIRAATQLDVQYAPPTNSVDNFPNPYIWDGTTYVTIDNYTYPTQGVTFCKYGRTTGKTCGVHDTLTMYSNPNWGVSYLRKILNNGTGIRFNDAGDSGGPVYYGTWALGWVHGHDTSNNMLYTPVDDFKRVQSAVDIIVYR